MKYIAYYDTPANREENRNYVLAATNKIDYICNALNRLGHPVEIISASMTANRKGCEGKTVSVSENTSLKLLPCLGRGILPKRLLGRFLTRLRIFSELVFRTQKGENVLVYHSLGYVGTVALARKLKGFRLILEAEEIYADVSGKKWDRRREFKTFAAADAYVFPSELLNEIINKQNKPYAIIHGTYQAEQDRQCNIFQDEMQGKIHCVYAGTFDPRKGGAMAAVAAAEFLPENYHIHILGSGSDADRKNIRDLIANLSNKTKCDISYDGLLAGEKYIRFLQSCDIGLSTQNPNAAFNATSFPSKILSYMANGLRVVSIRIPAIEDSAVGEYMYYYNRQSPEEIAKAIRTVDINNGIDPRTIIAELDADFQTQLRRMLEG